MDRFSHWHLHNEEGMCFGDTVDFGHAADIAASHAYPWCVADMEPVDGVLTIIEADFCIDVCREAADSEEE
jgi:hypothetical protein